MLSMSMSITPAQESLRSAQETIAAITSIVNETDSEIELVINHSNLYQIYKFIVFNLYNILELVNM